LHGDLSRARRRQRLSLHVQPWSARRSEPGPGAASASGWRSERCKPAERRAILRRDSGSSPAAEGHVLSRSTWPARATDCATATTKPHADSESFQALIRASNATTRDASPLHRQPPAGAAAGLLGCWASTRPRLFGLGIACSAALVHCLPSASTGPRQLGTDSLVRPRIGRYHAPKSTWDVTISPNFS
jgi:hypothetical protein